MSESFDMGEVLRLLRKAKEHGRDALEPDELDLVERFERAMKPAIDKLTHPETIEGYRLWESLPPDEQQRYMDWTPREVLVFKPLIDEMAGLA